MKLKRFALVFAVGAVLPVLFFLYCTTGSAKPPAAPDASSNPVGVEIKSVDTLGAKFLLKWKTVGTSLLPLKGFLIYQVANDTTKEESFKTPRKILRNLVELADPDAPGEYRYEDNPGLPVGTYYYKIAAIGEKPDGDDMYGAKSAPKTITIDIPPTGVLLINDGTPLVASSVVYINLKPIANFDSVAIHTNSVAQILADNTGKLTNPIAVVQLKPGGGKKFVKATVRRKGETSTYDLETFADIREPVAKVGIRNPELWKAKTLVGKHTNQTAIKFDIRLFGDRERVLDSLYPEDKTFMPQCYVWLAVNGKANTQMQDTIKDGWLETPPMPYTINFANPDTLYTYDLVAAMATGKNLVLTTTKDMTKRRAGAYYGGKEDTTKYNLGVYTDSKSIFYLKELSATDNGVLAGRKEFYLCAQFTGKVFGNQRFAMSYFNNSTRYFWDVYPPRVSFSEKLEGTPVEDDTVTQAFDVWMSIGPAVLDGAQSKPTELTMYIARTDKKKGKEVTLDDIENSPHMSWDYEFTTTDHMVRNVSFLDINPIKLGAEWPSGRYVMAMVTADDKGNRGIAPADNAKTNMPVRWNPRVFYVKTGK